MAQLPEAGLPPAHVGVAAGPVVVQGGDYFGRTVNLAARIAARAGAGQVLVSQSVVEAARPEGCAWSWGRQRGHRPPSTPPEAAERDGERRPSLRRRSESMAEQWQNLEPTLREAPRPRDGPSRPDVVGRDGIEPPTLRFSAARSTD